MKVRQNRRLFSRKKNETLNDLINLNQVFFIADKKLKKQKEIITIHGKRTQNFRDMILTKFCDTQQNPTNYKFLAAPSCFFFEAAWTGWKRQQSFLSIHCVLEPVETLRMTFLRKVLSHFFRMPPTIEDDAIFA